MTPLSGGERLQVEENQLRITPVIHISLVFFATVLMQAGTINTFTSQTAFNAAAGAVTVETFGTIDCIALQGPISSSSSQNCSEGSVPAGLLQPGATYSSPVGAQYTNAFNIDSGGGSLRHFWTRSWTEEQAPL